MAESHDSTVTASACAVAIACDACTTEAANSGW